MRMCLLTPLSRFIWRQRSCHCQHRWQSRKLDCFAHYYNFFGSSGSFGSMDVVHIKWANCPAGDHYRVKGKECYPKLGFQCITDCNRLILGIFGPMFRAQNDKETVKLDHHVNSFTSTRIRDWARPTCLVGIRDFSSFSLLVITIIYYTRYYSLLPSDLSANLNIHSVAPPSPPWKFIRCKRFFALDVNSLPSDTTLWPEEMEPTPPLPSPRTAAPRAPPLPLGIRP